LESRSAAAGGRSLDVVQREYEDLERATLQLNTDMSNLQEQLESQRALKQSLTAKYNQWREKGLEVERLSGDRERLEKEKKEADMEYKDVMEQGRDLESQMKPLAEQLDLVTREREANRTKQRRVSRCVHLLLLVILFSVVNAIGLYRFVVIG
jgi:chromosome segregation ATPase